MLIPGERDYPFPRLCAHRGISAALPENTLPAFGAAVALGAPEIELDVRFSKDGIPICLHDPVLDRVSNGHGLASEKTLSELKQLDFSCGKNPHFEALPVLTFEEVLSRFARHVIINLHIKGSAEDGTGTEIYPREQFRKITDLLDQYDMRQHVYIMGSANVQQRALMDAPDLPRCMGPDPDRWECVERAIEYKCCKVQMFKPSFNQEMIDKAHAHGIKCNIFWSDDPEEARQFFAMGFDCILTNDYWKLASSLNMQY